MCVYNRDALTTVIDEAASIPLKSSKIAECTQFRDRIDEINRHLDESHDAVIEEQMCAALQEAAEIRLLVSTNRDKCQLRRCPKT